jgi:hypothetical protein
MSKKCKILIKKSLEIQRKRQMCLNEKSHFKSQVIIMTFFKTEKSQSHDF